MGPIVSLTAGTGATGTPHLDAELVAELAGHAFPARRDDLLAALVRRHAPGALLWRLSRLSPQRTYLTAEDVVADLRPPDAPPAPV